MIQRVLRISILVLAVGLLGAAGAAAQGAGTAVTYHAGWNLVAFPTGTAIAGTSGTLSHWLTNADEYQQVPASGETLPAVGYWAYFPADTVVTLAPGGSGAYQVMPRAGHFVMVGDPSGTLPAQVTGADAVYTYDPANGYQQTASLSPGQGAWAISLAGNPITITPEGAGIPVPVAGSFSTHASPMGYSVSVPSDWVSATPPASQPHEDLRLRSVDAAAQAGVFVLTPAEGASLDPVQELDAFTQALVTQPQSTNVQVVTPATAAQVPNATAAATSTVQYRLDGTLRQDTFLVAVQGQTVYVLDIVVSGPYLAQPDQTASQLITPIVASFQVSS